MSDLKPSPSVLDLAHSRVKLNSSFCRDGLIPVKPTGRPVVFTGLLGVGEGKRRVTIRVGSVAKNRTGDDGPGLCPGLHIELWHLIIVLLSFWEDRDMVKDTIHPSFNSVWRRFTASNVRPNPRQLESFAGLMDELDSLRMAVEVEGKPERIVDVVHYATKRLKLRFGTTENVFDGFAFDPLFASCLLYAERLIDVRLDVLGGITSRYVRAAYLWLPSKAFGCPIHTEPLEEQINPPPIDREKVAVMGSAELCAKLGEPGLPRSLRKKMLTQNTNSVLTQLHGLPLLGQGLHLGVAWWDGSDDFEVGVYRYISGEWMPGPTAKPRQTPLKLTGAIAKAFIERGGGNREAFYHYMARWKDAVVEDYAIEKMQTLRVEKIEGSMPFFKQVLTLVGPDLFRDALGDLSEATINKADGAGALFSQILLRKVAERARSRTDQYLCKVKGVPLPDMGS